MSWLKGERILGTEAKALADTVASLLAPGWTAYGTAGTILTAVTTNPTLGDTTWAAHYRRPAGGDLVHVMLTMTIGATGFNAGNGFWRFLLPFAASSRSLNAAVGSFWVNDVFQAFRAGVVTLADATHVELYTHNLTGGPLGHGGTGTAWSAGDVIKISIAYEPA